MANKNTWNNCLTVSKCATEIGSVMTDCKYFYPTEKNESLCKHAAFDEDNKQEITCMDTRANLDSLLILLKNFMNTLLNSLEVKHSEVVNIELTDDEIEILKSNILKGDIKGDFKLKDLMNNESIL